MKKFKFELGEKVLDTIRTEEVIVMGASFYKSVSKDKNKKEVHKSTIYTVYNPKTKTCEERKSKELIKQASSKIETI